MDMFIFERKGYAEQGKENRHYERRKRETKVNDTTRLLSQYITDERFDKIPRDVRDEMKRRILDYLGVTLAGSLRMEGKLVRNIVMKFGGAEESTLIGFGDKVPCLNAALVNGTISHIIELGDWTRYLFHPGESILSAVFALGEREGIDGKRFITASVVGYETGLRIAYSANPGLRWRGFHTIGTAGPFGAAAACSNMLGLDVDHTEQALGLAGCQSAGLMAFLDGGGDMSKRLQAGQANANGLLAALLSQEGFVGPKAILESDRGFYKAFVQWHKYKYYPERVTDNLGHTYEIMKTNVKLHSCCGPIHPGLDAIEDMMIEHNINGEEVEKVLIKTFRNAVDGHEEISPDTVVGATMSYPYCVAVMFMNRKVSISDFTEKKLVDPIFMAKVKQIGKKVELIIDPEMEAAYPERYIAKVTLNLNGGRKYERTVRAAKGFYPENPVGDEEIITKFKGLAALIIPDKKIEELIQLIGNVEEIKNIRQLTQKLY
jgi:2-methylcitrate dehydratase PrpD